MDDEEFEIEEDVASGSEKTGMDRAIEIFNENKKLFIIVGVVILLLIILSAVTKSSDSKKVKLSEEEKTITTASGVTLELLVNDVKTTSGVKWESSDTRVATVDDSGTVHGVSAGKATITATYEGEKYKCEITVSNGDAGIKVESIKFTEGTIVMSVGSKYTPAVEVTPSEAQIRNKYFYSSDRNVATVDLSTGEITANQLGTANIRVSVNDAEKMTSAKLQVINGDITPGFYILPTSVKLSENDVTMTEGERKAITFTQEPENSSRDYINWVSSDPTIATVENNEIVALRPGEAEIAITSFGVNDKVKVHIKAASVEVTSVSLTSSSSVSMKVGDTKQIKAKVVPSNATNKELLYDSSNTSVVAVDSVGNMTGVSGGDATVTVKSASKPDLYATVNVTVTGDTTPSDPPYDPGPGGGGGTTTTVGTAKLTSNNDAVESSVSALSGKTMTSTKLTITTSGNVDKVLYCNYEYQKQSDCTTYMVYTSPFEFKTPGTFVFKVTPYYNNNAGTTSVRYVKISSSGGTSTGKCAAGKYLSFGTCYACPAGSYCYGDKKYSCPAGKGSLANASSLAECTTCAKGYYSTGDGTGCKACPSGYTTSGTGATSSSQCTVATTTKLRCNAGYYYNGSGNCTSCPANYYCPGVEVTKGSTKVEGKNACPSGTTSPAGSTSSSQCTTTTAKVRCNAGYYYNGSGNCTSCPANYYCPGVEVTKGSTKVEGKNACPSGYSSQAGSTKLGDCKKAKLRCNAGYYYNGSGNCTSCPANYYCPGVDVDVGSTKVEGKNACPSGYTSPAKSTSSSQCTKTTKPDAVCPTLKAYTGYYDGSSHTITVTGGSGGTIQYRTSSTGTWSTTKPTRKDVGTTTVYVRVQGDSSHNTKDCGSSTITVNKKVTPSVNCTVGYYYNSTTSKCEKCPSGYNYTIDGNVTESVITEGMLSGRTGNFKSKYSYLYSGNNYFPILQSTSATSIGQCAIEVKKGYGLQFTGYSSTTSTPYFCYVGTYADDVRYVRYGSTSGCTSCPSGKTTTYVGSTSASDCK